MFHFFCLKARTKPRIEVTWLQTQDKRSSWIHNEGRNSRDYHQRSSIKSQSQRQQERTAK